MSDGRTLYGFEWGPMSVERSVAIPGRGRALDIWVTDDRGRRQRVMVYCSDAGRRVRVFLGNDELTTDGEAS